jgi:2-C-methyl-D-erythritol 4-phosphate cytidylyltransferase
VSRTQARCWAVIPAAGTGSRMGDALPKQYLEVAGATLLEHALGTLLGCEHIAAAVVALHPEDNRAANLSVIQDSRVRTVTGADQRCDSVLAGLDALVSLAAPEDWVLVHDAARPCLQQEDLRRLIETVMATQMGGILAEPIVDTVKQATEDSRVLRTLDRATLWRAQTPQMFRISELRSALVRSQEQGLTVTDEASAMEMAGYPVQLIPGSATNLKVTVPADLSLAAWYLEQRVGSETG